jgi:hypothetical protein
MSTSVAVWQKKFFVMKSFERLVVLFRRRLHCRDIQKNFRRRDLADNFSRTAISSPIAIVLEPDRAAAVKHCDPNQGEMKSTHVRH